MIAGLIKRPQYASPYVNLDCNERISNYISGPERRLCQKKKKGYT